MGKSIINLVDVAIQKGYQDAPAAKFIAGKNGSGMISFKVSCRRYSYEKKEQVYDNYSVLVRGISEERSAKLLEGLKPGRRIFVTGDLSQENYKDKDYQKVTCFGQDSIVLSWEGNGTSEAPAKNEAPSDNVNPDEL